jgi:putative transposase
MLVPLESPKRDSSDFRSNILTGSAGISRRGFQQFSRQHADWFRWNLPEGIPAITTRSMAIRYRTFIPDETYFITFTILGWQKVFTSDKYCQLIFKWFDYVRNIYGNKIFGYVVMPNHVHCLMKISSNSKPLPILVLNAKRFLAYEIIDLLKEDKDYQLLNFFKFNKIRQAAKHRVFEDGYDSQIIQSEKFFLQKLNYIHKNPCQEKWELAKSPEEYLYSSASNYIFGKGIFPIDVVDF